MKNVKGKVEAIKKELEQPIPEPQEKKKMATKKKGGAKKKTTKKTTGAKRKTTGAKRKTTAASGVTLASLAKEAGISGQKARQKLRAANVERAEGGRWNFTGKADLKAARKALGLK